LSQSAIKTEGSANKAELLQNVVLSILANTNWIKTDLLSLLELIQDELGKVVKATDFCIGLQSENKELLDLYFVSGKKEEKSNHKQRPFGKGMAEYVIKKGKLSSSNSIRIRVISTNLKNSKLIFKNPYILKTLNYLVKFSNFVLIIINSKKKDIVEKDNITLRYYGIGAQIIKDLKVKNMILVTRSRKKIIGLEGFGLKIKKQEIIK